MKYLEFKKGLDKFTIFSLSDIRKIDPDFLRIQLVSWQKKGYIKKVIRGYYIFADLKIDENILFLISQKIYSPSYVSLESALSYHNLIPEGVFAVTSVTSKKSQILRTQVGNFVYKSIKSELMFGYKLIDSMAGKIKMAEPEKAILDYLYLNSTLSREADFEEWRLNPVVIEENWSWDKYKKYLQAFDSKALNERALRLLKFLNHA